ncbi:MAG: SPW repeat protein [Chloroflexi bacterium]|nr:SPW repeat protein [Chloroflexota bacterium]
MPWIWMLWINVVAGLYLIASPFIYGITDTTHTLISIVLGIVVLIVALVTWYGQYMLRNKGYVWLSWINVVLGLWTIAMPFVFGFTTGTMISYVIAGIVIFVVALAHWLVNFLVRPTVART